MNQTSGRSGLPARVYKRHGAFYYVDPHSRKWIRLGATEEEALAAHEQLMRSPSRPGTFAVLLDRYMRDVAPAKAPRTYQDNQAESKSLLKVFGKMRPESIRPKHVAMFLDERGKEAPVRANREKALLSHVFTMGMRWGVVDINPCRGVHRNPEKPRARYITDEEFETVHKLANQVVRDVMDMAFATAQRVSDVLSIRIEDAYTVPVRGLRFEQAKTSARVAINMNMKMADIFDRRRGDRPSGPLFEHGGKPYTYDGFAAMFKRTVRKAVQQQLIGSSFTFHDIRGKALTDAKKQGRKDMQQIAGHRSPTQTDDYIKKIDYEVVPAVEKNK